ncbi:MAG: hypothetical protein J5663_00475 [Bacteroidaceae bacterium]|nr:hypothetical protein [Bacteroidaceae bacterium]
MGYYKYRFEELNQLNMLDVVEKLNFTVKVSGNTRTILCPCHDDHHPSMVVYPHRVKCFACDKGFGVINFVMEVRHVDVKDACEWLYNQFGVGREWVETPATKGQTNRQKTPKRTTKAQSLQAIIDRAVSGCSCSAKCTKGTNETVYAFTLEYVAKHMSVDNSFCKCLRHLFNAETVQYVTEMYGIGNFGVDDTMFPIIDKDLRVHNIKIQHYDTNVFSDTFFHKDRGGAWWYGRKYLETHKGVSGTHDVNCYFGEHLISRFPSSTIILVESPKNAVLGACMWPEHVWVATGNKGMLTRDRLHCLRGRKVLVMPDCDAVDEWREKLDTMRDLATFIISDMVEEFRKLGNKADIGDWVVEKMRRKNE